MQPNNLNTEIWGKNPKRRLKILLKLAEENNWVRVKDIGTAVGIKDYNGIKKGHLEKLQEIGLLEYEEKAVKIKEQRQGWKKARITFEDGYKIQKNIDVLRNIIMAFSIDKEMEYKFLGSKYFKDMKFMLLDDFLDEMDLKKTDTPSFHGFVEIMSEAMEYPPILKLLVNKQITEDIIKSVIISNLGAKAINMDVQRPLTQAEKVYGLVGIVITCRKFDAIECPQAFINEFGKLQNEIESMQHIFDNLNAIIEENPKLKAKIIKRLEEIKEIKKHQKVNQSPYIPNCGIQAK